MSPQKNAFTISEEELAKELEISLERLDKIVDFFDFDPEDEWDLEENEDYIFLNKSKKIRKYSAEGALKIAYYLDDHEKRGIIYRIKDFITQHNRKIRNALARKVICEELSDEENKIIQVNGRSMIHKQSLRRILGTNGARLNRALDDLRKSDTPLEPDVDFAERELPKKNKRRRRKNTKNNEQNPKLELWFSGRGSFKISRELGTKLTDKSRRKMCLAVSKQIQPVLEQKDKTIRIFKQEVNKAKEKAKKRDKVCQVTRKKPDKYNNFNLVAHHLYCVRDYKHLATSIYNLLTIDERIHQEFHLSWMDGYDMGCTVQDFIDFVTERYPDKASQELLDRLYTIKKTFNIN